MDAGPCLTNVNVFPGDQAEHLMESVQTRSRDSPGRPWPLLLVPSLGDAHEGKILRRRLFHFVSSVVMFLLAIEHGDVGNGGRIGSVLMAATPKNDSGRLAPLGSVGYCCHR
jgi:hypothetical protein